MTAENLIAHFPANRNNNLTDMDRAIAIKLDHQFEEKDGKTIATREGCPCVDRVTLNPLPIGKVITDYFIERGWLKAENEQHGGITTASAFEKQWKVENPGKALISTEFVEALNEHAAATPGFEMYK